MDNVNVLSANVLVDHDVYFAVGETADGGLTEVETKEFGDFGGEGHVAVSGEDFHSAVVLCGGERSERVLEGGNINLGGTMHVHHHFFHFSGNEKRTTHLTDFVSLSLLIGHLLIICCDGKRVRFRIVHMVGVRDVASVVAGGYRSQKVTIVMIRPSNFTP